MKSSQERLVNGFQARVEQEIGREDLSLAEFMRGAWHIVEQAAQLRWNWHMDAMCEFLTEIAYRRILRGVITIPPRMAKSLTTSVMLPAWTWGEVDPALRFLYSSYSQPLALRDSVRCRRIIESRWYRKRYDIKFHLTTDQNTKSRFENNRTGERICFSLLGSVTGEGGNIVVVDDPHNVKERESEVREKTVEVFRTAMTSRLNEPEDDAILVVQQRVHDYDVAGYCIDTGEYVQLNLPNEFEPPRKCVIYFASEDSGRYLTNEEDEADLDQEPFYEDPRTIEGELLFLERVGEAATARAKVELMDQYYAQYQQDPSKVSDDPMHPEDSWRYYVELPYRWDMIVLTWDCAKKGKKERKSKKGSYVVGQVWAVFRGRRYLLHQVRREMGFSANLQAVRDMLDAYSYYDVCLIEDAANGTAILNVLREEEVRDIVGVQATSGSKEVRAARNSPTVRNGHCYLPDPETAPWVAGFVHRFKTFPFGPDDEIDAWSQANDYIKRHTIDTDGYKDATR